MSAHLGALPPKRRDEELREMRAHLENAMVVSRELGRSEDEASRAAITQFGTPKDLGGNLVWAWKRGRKMDRKSFFGAIATSLVLLNTVPYLMTALTCMLAVPLVGLLRATCHWPEAAVSAFCFLSVDLPAWLLIGAGAGRLFPRRAALGTGLVMGAWAVFQITHSLYWEFICWPGHLRYAYFARRSGPVLAENIVRLIILDVALALAATASAWAAGRWRSARARRARIARV